MGNEPCGRWSPIHGSDEWSMEFDDQNPWSVPSTPPCDPRCEDASTSSSSAETSKDDVYEAEESLQPTAPKYQLRPQARGSQLGFATTWIDRDQTGDYDPEEELRQARLRRNRKRAKIWDGVSPSNRHLDDNDYDEEASQLEVPNLPVRLDIRSNAARSKFVELVNGLCAKSQTVNTDTNTNGYSLRKRSRGTAFTYKDNYDCRKDHLDPDIPNDPTGHPFARGCWPCVYLGHECSLRDDESSWPCSTCVEDGTDCELVTMPMRKRACQRCKQRRVSCSYTYTLNHGVACQQCMDDGHSCLAGPAKDAIRLRARYDTDWATNPIPAKKTPKIRDYAACAECREAGQACAFQQEGNRGQPCERCTQIGAQCTVESLVPQQHTKVRRPHRDEEKLTYAIATEETSTQSAQINCPRTKKTVTTKFSHPIVFNHDDPTDAHRPCHFCVEPLYGIFGLGQKEVEVMEWSDGRGLEEISGGHHGDGVENTRMCPPCTLGRLSIVVCSGHEMRPLAGGKGRQNSAVDDNDAMMELLNGTAGRNRQWCAICPAPARHQCCTMSEGVRGCGLLLCGRCMLDLSDVHDGDFQKMLHEIPDEPTKARILGPRADYELLKQDGLLMRFVLWSNQ